MIENISLNPLRVLDFFQVATLIAEYVGAEDTTALQLTAAETRYTQALSRLDDALKQSNSIAATKDILKADELRDRTWNAIIRAIRNATESPIEDEARDAEILLQEADKYGKNIARLPLREESAALKSIIQDFEKAANVPRVANLNLANWVAKLEQQNTAFDGLYLDRTGEQATVVAGAVKAARVALQEALENLIKTINAHAFLSGEAPYKRLADRINAEINRALSEAKARRKPKQDGEK